MLSCLMMTAVSSICLIASNIFWCTFDEIMTWFCFSGRISRVHFVVYLLFSIVAVVAYSMRRLQIMFLPLPSFPSWSFLLLILSFFPFASITRSETKLCFFLVVEGAVTFLNNSTFSLELLLGLVFSALGFDVWVSSWRFWMAVAGGGSSGRFVISYVGLVL